MDRLPHAPEFDSTLAFLREGYTFGLRRFSQLESDAFVARLTLRPVVFARGADAVAMFYHPDRFTRRGAVPPTTLMLLQDFGSVQRLDGEDHRHRKAMFLRLLDVESATRMVAIFREEWERQAARWERMDEVVLHTEMEQLLCRTACRWAGVPLPEDEVAERTRDFATMIDGAGSYGARFAEGLVRRNRAERWIRAEIRALRQHAGRIGTPAARIAWHRERDGSLLDERVAAVELINLLRPTVALARWVTFAAAALHQHPHLLPRLRAREPRLLLHVVQEVRRVYPFFPVVGGRVREAFEWRGCPFLPGDRVMLDLHATNHHPALWSDPDRFDPDRYRHRGTTAYDFVPQGGGDFANGHRCPGENPGIALLMSAVDALATRLRYTVPPQDLSHRLDRMPSLPRSGVILRDVRRVGAARLRLVCSHARAEPSAHASERARATRASWAPRREA